MFPHRIIPRAPAAPPVTHRLSPAHLALTLAVVTVWGFAFVPIRLALDEIPPFALAALRFLFAAVPAFLLVRRPDMPWRGLHVLDSGPASLPALSSVRPKPPMTCPEARSDT